MKKLATVALGLAVLLSSIGCALIPTEQAYWDYRFENARSQDTNSVQSSADRLHTHRQVAAQDARAFVDDWDVVWLKDRPSRLSRWHNR